MNEPNLFENEQQLIDAIGAYLKQPPECNCENRSKLETLYFSYKKFLRQFMRIVKLNDRQQIQLKNHEEELRAEIEKRKEIEQKLRNNEAQLIQAKEIAEKALQDKARFFASMSHEIRTPLNGVLASADLLQATSLNRQQKDLISTITASGKILLVVINDILDFSKIESGNLKLEQTQINLEELIADTFEITSPQAHNKDLELVCIANLPHNLLFSGDPTRISQVLVNLINNAIKFTSKGEITLTIDLQQNQAQQELVFGVHDSGIGITQENLDRLFVAYRQAETSTNRKYGGTGLGLSICQKLTQLWQGRIWAESTVGQGSSFYFSYPLEDEVELLPNTALLQFLQNKHIIIIEPNPTLARFFKQSLGSFHLQTTIYPNLAQASNHLSLAEEYDLLIVDHRALPAMSQNQLDAHELANLPKPILLISRFGVGTANFEAKCPQGAILNKPLLGFRLGQALQRVLKGEPILPNNFAEPAQQYPNLYEEFPMTLLIAEDNKINQKIVQTIFNLLGFEPVIAENGKLALELSQKQHFDLIFMDMEMPEMDGLTATQEIRKNQATQHTPIIAMTANATEQDRKLCLDTGMSDYLSKPLTTADLIHTLTHWGNKIGAHQKGNRANVTYFRKATHLLQDLAGDLFSKEIIEMLFLNYSQDLLDELIVYYIEELQNSIKEIQAFSGVQDFLSIKKSAHKIKGSSLNMGVSKAAEFLGVIEHHANLHEIQPINQALKQLEAVAPVICESILQFSSKSSK